MAEQVLVGLAGRRGRALQDRLDRASGDAGSEQLTHKLDRVTARDAVSDREAGDRCLEARAEGSPRHVGRQFGARGGAAGRATQARHVDPLQMARRLSNGKAPSLSSVAKDAEVKVAAMLDSLSEGLRLRVDEKAPRDRCSAANRPSGPRLGEKALLRGLRPGQNPGMP